MRSRLEKLARKCQRAGRQVYTYPLQKRELCEALSEVYSALDPFLLLDHWEPIFNDVYELLLESKAS